MSLKLLVFLICSHLNPSVTDRFKCVGARFRQFGEFRPLRKDCARLRDRRMSWIVSKGRAAAFLSEIANGTSVEYYLLSEFKKVCAMIFSSFTILRADCARLIDHRILKWVLLKLQFMIPERRLNLLTLFSRF